MDSFSKSSTSFNMSTSSESENEIRNKMTFDAIKVDFEKTFKTGLTSNVSRQRRQPLNDSLRNFKTLKRKKNLHSAFDSRLENKYSASSYSFNPSKANHNLSGSENLSTYSNEKLKFQNKNTAFYKSVDLNKEFAIATESSSDSDVPDLKYIKLISRDKEINTSSISKERQCKPYSNKNKLTVYDSSNCGSASSSSSNFSQINTKSENFNNNYNCGTELNLDELLLDCSLSDILLIRKDGGDIDSQLCPTLVTDDNCFVRMKSKSPKPLPLNNSFRVDDDSLPPKPPNVIIKIPDLMSNATEGKHNQTVDTNDTMETDGQENKLNNEHCKVIRKKSFSNEVDLNKPVIRSNSCTLIEESIASTGSEPVCKYCNRSSKLKANISNCSSKSFEIIDNSDKKLIKSKRSHRKILSNDSDVLRLRKSYDMKKLRNRNSSIKIAEDIGLEYDTIKDNYMVELPNGTLVPEFLSTLKLKHVKKLCACGITLSEIPLTWDEQFHDILHQNIHKLWFKSNIIENNTMDIINCKQEDLFYRIINLNTNHYNDENIRKSIKDVDDFVCLEYGIFKYGFQSYKNSSCFVAMLPNFKVIGYLEVKPLKKAYKFIDETKPLEETVIVKFGVSKIWVLIKYRNKNVDINLLNTFCEKENLQKEDLAFSLNGCQGITFIQKYTGNTYIFDDNEIPAISKVE